MFENLFSQIITEVMMIGAGDIATIVTLAALEGILSVDNALVLAILVRRLPAAQRKKALTYGIVGAFFFRFLALLLAAYLMQMLIFKLIGGGYLIYLAMKHMFFFYREEAHQGRASTSVSFWKTVLLVELTDIAFSIDSITTAVAMTDKLAVVWIGGIMGIIFLRFAAGFFVRLLEKLPKLEDLAYQLIFFIGIKLVMEGVHIEIPHNIFWLMMAIIATLGASLVFRDYHQRKSHNQYSDQLLADLTAGQLSREQLLENENLPLEVALWLEKNGWPPAQEDRS